MCLVILVFVHRQRKQDLIEFYLIYTSTLLDHAACALIHGARTLSAVRGGEAFQL